MCTIYFHIYTANTSSLIRLAKHVTDNYYYYFTLAYTVHSKKS